MVFLVLQCRREDPLLPLSLLRDRNRSGSYAAVLFIGAGLIGTFYLLTLFLQQVLQFNPLHTGLASLPFSAGIILSAAASAKLAERLAPRAVAVPGLLLAAGGMYGLSLLSVDASYFGHVMPALFITSFGLGLSFVPMTLTAVHGVAEQRVGIASALVNMAQQIGAALGLAVLTTISVTAANDRSNVAANVALVHGYTTAFFAGAIILVIAAAVTGLAVTVPRQQTTGQA